MVLVRQEIGDVLRDFRLQKAMTLRQVAGRASVALGYLSEVERGQKEASSEILASVADALDTPVSVIMREVGDRLAVLEGLEVPDALPADFGERFGRADGGAGGPRPPHLVAHGPAGPAREGQRVPSRRGRGVRRAARAHPRERARGRR